MPGLGTSTQSSTEQSQTSYPQWTQDAQQQTWQTGNGMLQNFLRNPQYAVAGMNTDQMKAFDLARNTARTAYTAPQINVPGSPNLTAAMGTAAQVTPGAIQQFMNPYISSVIDPTVAKMRGERDNAAAAIGAKYAAQGGLGGSGDAIARGQLDRSFGENVASTVGTLMAAGYDKATATALANAQMQQQTGLANQSAENTMRTTGADYGLKGAQVQDTLRTTQQAREQSALQQILAGGNQQQEFGQKAMDVPWTMLQMLMGLTPKQTNSQTYGQKESESTASPMSTLSSGIGAISSLAGLFSDRREKEDIKKLGKDPESGLDMYAYRYKGDPKSYPKVVGPMAQDIEKAHPGSTHEIGGRKVVSPSALDMLLKGKAA